MRHQSLQKDLLAAADAVERSFGEGQPVGLEDSKLSHSGHDNTQARGHPAPHPGSHPEQPPHAQPEAGQRPAPGPKEPEISGGAGAEQGQQGGDADTEAALGAALEAARPVTDLLDEVGTGRWQHASPEGARLSPAIAGYLALAHTFDGLSHYALKACLSRRQKKTVEVAANM